MDLSIIIPMYNGRLFIKESVNSLRSINCSKEILIVDDGSTDGSYEYCCWEFAGYEDVTIIRKENGGIASARNCGLGMANADYLMFVDQDDHVNSETIEKAVDTCREARLDGAIWSCDYYQDGQAARCDLVTRDCVIDRNVIRSRLIKALLFRTGCDETTYVGHIWAGIYKREIVENSNICFRHFIDYEDDQLFVLDFLMEVEAICLIKDTGYYWHVSRTSYSHSYRQLSNLIQRYEAYFSHLKEIANTCFDVDTISEFKVFAHQLTVCEAIRNAGISGENRKQCTCDIKRALREEDYSEAIKTSHPYIKERRYVICLLLVRLGLLDICLLGTSLFFTIKKRGM